MSCSACQKAEDDIFKLNRCGLCRQAQYCSSECQQQHWSSHNATCFKTATKALLTAITQDDTNEVMRLAKTRIKRVLNGKVDYSFPSCDGSRTVTLRQWTALHECVRCAKADMMTILIHHGANANKKDVDGETPLFVAASSGNVELVRLLIAGGAKPNVLAKDGWSCLMAAARSGDYEVTKALLECGADVNCEKDMFGRGPLDMAAHRLTGQGTRMTQGESLEDACARYQRLYQLLLKYA